MKQSIVMTSIFALILGTTFTPFVIADSTTDSRLEFAGTLEETLGHFWALEQNLDEKNADLALVHATHPIAELYDTMSTHLKENPQFDAKLQDTLMQLQHKANTQVTREDAQAAIDDAKDIIEEARMIVVGEKLTNDAAFKAQLLNGLLETSKVEYMEAVSDGIIEEMAEFQDGSAFVWRSQQVFEEIEEIVDVSSANKIKTSYDNLWAAYDDRAEPSEIEDLVDSIILEFEKVSGVESEESGHMMEVFGMKSPLKQVKSGIAPSDVECKSGMDLILKSSNGQPVCVYSATASKLLAMGWGTNP